MLIEIKENENHHTPVFAIRLDSSRTERESRSRSRREPTDGDTDRRRGGEDDVMSFLFLLKEYVDTRPTILPIKTTLK